MVRSHRGNVRPRTVCRSGSRPCCRSPADRTALRTRFHLVRLQQLLTMPTFPKQTFLALATFAAILLAVHYGISRAKGLDPAALRPIVSFPKGRAAFVPIVRVPFPSTPAALAIPDPLAHGVKAAANSTLESQYLFDGNGALDHFYAALRDLHSGQSRRNVRIVHFGDSPTTADLITGDARELLQERFGNGGPGFLLIAKPW